MAVSWQILSRECSEPSENLPWTKRPASENGAYDLPTSNVKVAGVQRSDIVPDTQRIGRDIRAERGENECERCEGCTDAIVPLVDELEWVPENLTVKGDACTRHGNTDKAG
jgi:hypothetical protein